MAYIKVDHSQLQKTANAVDKYVETLKSSMNSAQGELNTLSGSWEGADFRKFKSMFAALDDSGSNHAEMVKSLEAYSSYLKHAAIEYRNAQRTAYNRANLLPRW